MEKNIYFWALIDALSDKTEFFQDQAIEIIAQLSIQSKEELIRMILESEIKNKTLVEKYKETRNSNIKKIKKLESQIKKLKASASKKAPAKKIKK